jgi:peptidoglycan L-alanyl-D-glutamate endopeptidase CwlK
MTFSLSQRSTKALEGVHPDMVKVVKRAIQITDIDFVVTEGLRSLQKQKQLVAAGASQTMRSRHLTGHAVDLAALVAGKVRWDFPLYCKLAMAMKKASAELEIPIRWGGSWKELSLMPDVITTAHLSRSFADGPHFELPSRVYPT